MKPGDKVKIVRGNHIGKTGIVKSKDHSYRKFGVKQYGLKFNIVEENGDIISVDANEAELVEVKNNVSGSK